MRAGTKSVAPEEQGRGGAEGRLIAGGAQGADPPRRARGAAAEWMR